MGRFAPEKRSELIVPRFILIPCGYSNYESPCELTSGESYVLFLEDRKGNYYHPLDPASTHIVRDNQVQEFGVNAWYKDGPGSKRIELAKFKHSVDQAKIESAESKTKTNSVPTPKKSIKE
jgi:hypothetical protein